MKWLFLVAVIGLIQAQDFSRREPTFDNSAENQAKRIYKSMQPKDALNFAEAINKREKEKESRKD